MTPAFAQRVHAERAFEKLYQRHVADVYRYALAVLRNEADAEDVTQTTFLNAFRALERGEHPRSPHNWLIRITHNVCRQRFRQESRRPREVEFDETLAESPFHDRPEGPSPEDIRRALGHLAFNQRSALVMRELEGRSYAEIAEILGVTVAAVETLIFRARRALREQLEERLTCQQAERAVSLQLDGELPRRDAGRLRAHLRECETCAGLARRQRAQRVALRGLAAVPLPGSLGSLFGGGGGAAAGGVAVAKIGAAAAVVLVAGGVATQVPLRSHHVTPARPAHRAHPTVRQPAGQALQHRATMPATGAKLSAAKRKTLKAKTVQAHKQKPLVHPVRPATSRRPGWAGQPRAGQPRPAVGRPHAHSPPAKAHPRGKALTSRKPIPKKVATPTKKPAFSSGTARNPSGAATQPKGDPNEHRQPAERGPGVDGLGAGQGGTEAQDQGGGSGNGGGKPSS